MLNLVLNIRNALIELIGQFLDVGGIENGLQKPFEAPAPIDPFIKPIMKRLIYLDHLRIVRVADCAIAYLRGGIAESTQRSFMCAWVHA